jgi:hypothetical protein
MERMMNKFILARVLLCFVSFSCMASFDVNNEAGQCEKLAPLVYDVKLWVSSFVAKLKNNSHVKIFNTSWLGESTSQITSKTAEDESCLQSDLNLLSKSYQNEYDGIIIRLSDVVKEVTGAVKECKPSNFSSGDSDELAENEKPSLFDYAMEVKGLFICLIDDLASDCEYSDFYTKSGICAVDFYKLVEMTGLDKLCDAIKSEDSFSQEEISEFD